MSSAAAQKPNSKQNLCINFLNKHFGTGDNGVSVPRQSLFDAYLAHCADHSLPAMNAAGFGKIIRYVFPDLRTRRLGTRGNSKYHYFGIHLRPESSLEMPDAHVESHDRETTSGGASGPNSRDGKRKRKSSKSGPGGLPASRELKQLATAASFESRSGPGSGSMGLMNSTAGSAQSTLFLEAARANAEAAATGNYPGMVSHQRGSAPPVAKPSLLPPISLPSGYKPPARSHRARASHLVMLVSQWRESFASAVVGGNGSSAMTGLSRFWADTVADYTKAQGDYALLGSPTMCRILVEADRQCYQFLSEALFPSALAPATADQIRFARDLADSLVHNVSKSLVGAPPALAQAKVAAATAAAARWSREANLGEIAVHVCGILEDEAASMHLAADLSAVSAAKVVANTSFGKAWPEEAINDLVHQLASFVRSRQPLVRLGALVCRFLCRAIGRSDHKSSSSSSSAAAAAQIDHSPKSAHGLVDHHLSTATASSSANPPSGQAVAAGLPSSPSSPGLMAVPATSSTASSPAASPSTHVPDASSTHGVSAAAATAGGGDSVSSHRRHDLGSGTAVGSSPLQWVSETPLAAACTSFVMHTNALCHELTMANSASFGAMHVLRTFVDDFAAYVTLREASRDPSETSLLELASMEAVESSPGLSPVEAKVLNEQVFQPFGSVGGARALPSPSPLSFSFGSSTLRGASPSPTAAVMQYYAQSSAEAAEYAAQAAAASVRAQRGGHGGAGRSTTGGAELMASAADASASSTSGSAKGTGGVGGGSGGSAATLPPHSSAGGHGGASTTAAAAASSSSTSTSTADNKDTAFRPVRLSAGPVFMGVSPANLPISGGSEGRGSPDELLRAFTATSGGGHRLRGMTPSAATPSLSTPSNLSTTPSNH